MGKVSRLFVCSSCGRPAAQWSGRCPACGEWGTVGEEHPARSGGAARLRSARVAPLTIDPEDHRIRTGFSGVDRVLGGGLVPGSVVLLAGAPGIGKSTLLLQLASRLSSAGHPCLLASGEESLSQVARRARRVGVPLDGPLRFVPGRDLLEVVAAAEVERPAVLVVDSIQTVRNPDSDSLPGGTAQVRVCADALIGLAKEHGVSVILVGHVTKDGDVAGPRTLEHAVDAVVTFEGDAGSGLRVLIGGKNRFGAEGEVAWFEMSGSGLVETDPGMALAEATGEPGCATAVALAGRRAFAVDVQALVVPTDGPARRQVAGLDPRRFHIVAAVVDRSVGSGRRAHDLKLTRSELFGTVGGGLRLEDPGGDLAVAAALASAATGLPPPPRVGFVGELSLTGAVRPVVGLEQRVAAAASAGLDAVWGPPGMSAEPRGARSVQAVPVGHVRDALTWAFGRDA